MIPWNLCSLIRFGPVSAILDTSGKLRKALGAHTIVCTGWTCEGLLDGIMQFDLGVRSPCDWSHTWHNHSLPAMCISKLLYNLQPVSFVRMSSIIASPLVPLSSASPASLATICFKLLIKSRRGLCYLCNYKMWPMDVTGANLAQCISTFLEYIFSHLRQSCIYYKYTSVHISFNV